MNIDNLIKQSLEVVQAHKLEPGVYCRWLWQDEKGSRRLGINEYGCADAANILYTIGAFPADAAEREASVRALQSLQDEKTGLFTEETHHFIHTTAHCAAALELFEAKPLYKMHDLKQYTTVSGLYQLLDSIDYANNAWDGSHEGAGIYAALVLNGEVDLNWQEAYFKWFFEEADPDTGFWRKGYVDKGNKPLYYHLAGTFHYLFNHEYAKMPIRYPEKMIDTCLWLYNNKKMGSGFHEACDFLAVDFIYCLNRALRQCGHRTEEAKAVMRDFAEKHLAFLNSLDWKTHDGINDLHRLFGVLCCLAELQQALPGEIRSEKPLKLVLDRRPFI